MRFGVVGVRGLSYLDGILDVPGTELSMLCELDRSRADRESMQWPFRGLTESYEELLAESDAVVIGTPMNLHASQSIQALIEGKHVLSEVTAAVSLEECGALATAARRSPAVYCMSENYLHFRENVLIQRLVEEGLFGEPTFAEGEYVHEVRNMHAHPDGSPTWRVRWQIGARGCTYGTHSQGPAMRWMKTNDSKDRVASVCCLGTGARTVPEHPQDDTSITLCQLASGRLVKLRLDMMSNRPHEIYYSLQGTRGVYESGRCGAPPCVWFGESVAGDTRQWRPLEDFANVLPHEYRHAKGGHGGGDYHVGRLFAEAAQGLRAPDVGIDEALEWTAVGLCAQQSVLLGGSPVKVPSFDALSGD